MTFLGRACVVAAADSGSMAQKGLPAEFGGKTEQKYNLDRPAERPGCALRNHLSSQTEDTAHIDRQAPIPTGSIHPGARTRLH